MQWTQKIQLEHLVRNTCFSFPVRPVKYGEDPGSSMKSQKVQLERSKPVETFEPFKEDTLSAITGIYSGGQPYANTLWKRQVRPLNLKQARKTRQGRNCEDIAEGASERSAFNTFETFLWKSFLNRVIGL